MAHSISPDVADILTRSTVEGMLLRLPDGQLSRPLYEATNKALAMLGGKWDRRKGGHVFPFDPAAKIADALGTGKVVSRQQTLQLFETPVDLADRLVRALGHIEGQICLEPSAGRGRIVQALAMRDPARVIAVEIDEDNAQALRDQNQAHQIIVGDLLAQDLNGLRVDAVVMNPPFTGNQDIRHVRHAFTLLRDGGVLAAIVGEHSFSGQERECVEWRDWLTEVEAEVEIIPAGAFKESGTSIQTRMVVLWKTAARTTPPSVSSI